MTSKTKQPLGSKGGKIPTKTNFLANLSKSRISESDLENFSHEFVYKLLIPELLKCTNTKQKNQKQNRVRKDSERMAAKQSNPPLVPGNRHAQCIDESPRLSPNSRVSERREQFIAATMNKKKSENSTRSKMTPSKSILPAKTIAANEKLKLAKLKNDKLMPAKAMNATPDFNTESAVVQAVETNNGDLMISEIIIKFCRNANNA